MIDLALTRSLAIAARAAAFACVASGALAGAQGVPKTGATLPEFRMADQDGRLISSASLRGHRFVLAFYPKDFTGG